MHQVGNGEQTSEPEVSWHVSEMDSKFYGLGAPIGVFQPRPTKLLLQL
jgi:hypothetical protein